MIFLVKRGCVSVLTQPLFINLFISYKTFKYLYLCLFTP